MTEMVRADCDGEVRLEQREKRSGLWCQVCGTGWTKAGLKVGHDARRARPVFSRLALFWEPTGEAKVTKQAGDVVFRLDNFVRRSDSFWFLGLGRSQHESLTELLQSWVSNVQNAPEHPPVWLRYAIFLDNSESGWMRVRRYAEILTIDLGLSRRAGSETTEAPSDFQLCSETEPVTLTVREFLAGVNASIDLFRTSDFRRG